MMNNHISETCSRLISRLQIIENNFLKSLETTMKIIQRRVNAILMRYIDVYMQQPEVFGN